MLGETRVLTTAIATEIDFGNFDVAMAYAILLMAIVIVLALTISLVERVRQEEGLWGKMSFWRGLGGG